MGFAKASGKGVAVLKVFQETGVGVEDARGYTHDVEEGVEQGAEDLVEAFPNVRGRAKEGVVEELSFLEE